MSGAHLGHTIKWDDLLAACKVFMDPGIRLPVCENGKIHIDNKKAQMQVENRKYLVAEVCGSRNCEVIGNKVFRKNSKNKICLPQWFGTDDLVKNPKLEYFYSKLSELIREFADTERKKFIQPKPEGIASDRSVEELSWHGCRCDLFAKLIEVGDYDSLLSHDKEQIRAVLNCQHGGQAVGNNMRFLYFHVMRVYIYTNLIIAANLQAEDWGPMKSRNGFEQDCDGITFLPESRKWLTDDIYMKDMKAMKELLKVCFRFAYYIDMLFKEIEGDDWGVEETKDFLISNI